METKWEKMSKSRNNVITIEEVIYGVANLAGDYQFRLENGTVLDDYKEWGVWRNRHGDSMFYTSTKTGKLPVFLCHKDDATPPPLLINGTPTTQHEPRNHG